MKEGENSDEGTFFVCRLLKNDAVFVRLFVRVYLSGHKRWVARDGARVCEDVCDGRVRKELCNVEWRVAVGVLRIDGGALRDKLRHRLDVAIAACAVDRHLPAIILVVQVAAVLDEQADDVG